MAKSKSREIEPASADKWIDLSPCLSAAERKASRKATPAKPVKQPAKRKGIRKPEKVTPENPKFFGISDESIILHGGSLAHDADNILAALADVAIPQDATITEYADAFESLDDYDQVFGVFDRCRGEIVWLKGRILNLLKDIRPGMGGIAQRGELSAFHKRFKISDDTSENFRHINHFFRREQARELGYCEMMAMYRVASRKVTGKGEPKAEAEAETDSGETADATPHGIARVVKPLTLATLPKTVNKLFSSAELLANEESGISKMPDSYDNPQAALTIVEKELTQAMAAMENAKRVVEQLQKLRDELQELATK